MPIALTSSPNVAIRSMLALIGVAALSACGEKDGEPASSDPDACASVPSDATNCGACGVCSGTCSAGRCLTTLAAEQNSPLAIAVDPTSVYFANGWVSPQRSGSVMKVPLDGGVATALASGLHPSGIAVDATRGDASRSTTRACFGDLDTPSDLRALRFVNQREPAV